MEEIMETLAKRIVCQLGIIVSICILLGCDNASNKVIPKKEVLNFKLPFYNSADFTPKWIHSKAEMDSIHTIPSFEFIDQDNNKINKESVKGKIYLVNFFYTECSGICPMMTSTLKIIDDTFKNNPNLMILSTSVTPEIDQPEILKRYKLNNKITNPNWHFLTGKKNQIYSLARKGYFIEEEIGLNKDSSEFLHTEHVLLIDQGGHIRGIYNGTLQLEAQRMIADIREL